MADSIISQLEETRAREFRDRLGLNSNAVDSMQLTRTRSDDSANGRSGHAHLEGTYRTRPLAGSSYLPRDPGPMNTSSRKRTTREGC